MFYALPAETVFEAKERNKKATFYLFFLLIFSYIFFFDLMAVAGYFLLDLWLETHVSGMVRHSPPEMGLLLQGATLAAIILAVVHFFLARSRPLDSFLRQMKTRSADPRDESQAQFINIVQEVELATQVRGIRAVVLPYNGCNAFSLQDNAGRAAIGVTQGVFSKLNRNEISAVVAHEAAHLVQGDTKLVTTACFLFNFFGDVNEGLGRGIEEDAHQYQNGGNRYIFSFWILWFFSGVGYFFSNLVFVAFSRQREYLADAVGVRLCKDPLALSDGIHKMSRLPGGEIPDDYVTLFTIHPYGFDSDEEGGALAEFLGSHPPLPKRLSRILAWAKASLEDLPPQEDENKRIFQPTTLFPSQRKLFMVHRDNLWTEPKTPLQLVSTGEVTPSSWVCEAGGQQVTKAADLPEFLALFQSKVKESKTSNISSSEEPLG